MITTILIAWGALNLGFLAGIAYARFSPFVVPARDDDGSDTELGIGAS